MLPASIGAGFGQSLAWTAQVAYMRAQAEDYDRTVPTAGRKTGRGALYRFNGVFLACFQTSHVWGNLVSSLTFWGAGVDETRGVDMTGDGGNLEGMDSQWPRWPAVEGGASCGIYDDQWTTQTWNISTKGKQMFISTKGKQMFISTKGKQRFISTKGKQMFISTKGKQMFISTKGKQMFIS